MDVKISMEYPEKFQEGTNFFSPGVAYRFVSKEYSSEDFTFGLALCQAYKNMSLEKTPVYVQQRKYTGRKENKRKRCDN